MLNLSEPAGPHPLIQQFEIEFNRFLRENEFKVRGCFSEMSAATEAMRKLVDKSQEERKFFLNKEQKAAEKERERKEQIELEKQLEEERKRLEQLKAMENEPQPDPSLPNQACVTCFEEENQALMFGCRAADGSPHDEVHYLCKTCCINYGESKLGDGSLADGGIGLPCASFPACKGVLLWGPLKKILPETLTKHLDKQFDTTALHGIEGIEYCKSCTFGNVIESKIMKYFACQNKDCMARFCRTCKTDYDKHIGKTCDEVDPTRKDKRYALEEFLSATKFRVCSNCGTRYTKDEDGSCNKMTCACKTTQCYICKEPNVNYNHFGEGDKCRLFSNTHEDDKINLEHAINEARDNDQWREFLPTLLEMKNK